MDNVDENRQCPYCKESIKAEAVKCKHCGSAVAPEQAPHGGNCPYCKEEIHPEAIKCKHCKSSLTGSAQAGITQGGCGCNKSQEDALRQALGRLSTTGTRPPQTGATNLLRARRPGTNIVIVGGPLDPGDPLPCEGQYQCYTVCLPLVGCIQVCGWMCNTV